MSLKYEPSSLGRKCEHLGCLKQPSFGDPETGLGSSRDRFKVYGFSRDRFRGSRDRFRV